MRPTLLTAALACSMLSSLALAQTTPPAGTSPSAPANPPATTAPSPGPSSSTQQGIQAVNSATMAVQFVTVQPADVLSSRLVGTDVFNNQNESIGEIEDLVIENGRTVRAVVIGVGGFLGIGERYVAVDPSTIVLSRQGNESWRAVINTSRDDLKNAPSFDYSRRR